MRPLALGPLILVALTSTSIASAATPNTWPENESDDPVQWHAKFCGQLATEEQDSCIESATTAPDAFVRMLAATSVRSCNPPRHFARLLRLLKDHDPVVRRAAAETLMGEHVFKKNQHPQDYGYEDVLQAEGSAKALFAKLAKAHGKAALDLERQIIALGWPAFLEVRSHLDRMQSVEGCQAYFIMQEILNARQNVLTSWWEDVRRKMDRPVTLDVVEMPVSDAIRKVSVMTGIPVQFDARLSDEDLKFPVTLRIVNLKSNLAFAWLAKLQSTYFFPKDEALYFTKQGCTDCCVSMNVFDVRDLYSNEDSDWLAHLQRDLIGFGLEFFPGSGTGIEFHDGILEVWYVGSGTFTRKKLAPIAQWLNEKRRSRGLALMPYPINEIPLAFE